MKYISGHEHILSSIEKFTESHVNQAYHNIGFLDQIN